MQAGDDFRYPAAHFCLVIKGEILLLTHFVDLRPTPIPHLGLYTLTQDIFDFKKILAEAKQQKAVEILVPRFTVETQLQPRA